MRVSRTFIPLLAGEIVNSLSEKGLVELKMQKVEVLRQAEQLIAEELSVEDRLNREVRELLKQYDLEIEKGRLDYRKLFELTKQKLVKERNIVL